MNQESLFNFKKGLEKHIEKTFASLLKEARAEEQAVITKHLKLLEESSVKTKKQPHHEIVLQFPRLFSVRNIIKYAVLSWWLPDWTRIELQEVLRIKALKLDYPEVGAYLYSRELCIFALYRETDCSHSDLFGNLLQNGVFENINTAEGSRRIKKPDLIRLKIKFDPSPLRVNRKRGYNDHGSYSSISERARKVADQSAGQALQLEIELKRLQIETNYNLRIVQLRQQMEGIE